MKREMQDVGLTRMLRSPNSPTQSKAQRTLPQSEQNQVCMAFLPSLPGAEVYILSEGGERGLLADTSPLGEYSDASGVLGVAMEGLPVDGGRTTRADLASASGSGSGEMERAETRKSGGSGGEIGDFAGRGGEMKDSAGGGDEDGRTTSESCEAGAALGKIVRR